MAEYIELETLLKRLEVTPILMNGIPYQVRDGVIDLVRKQPATDVAPVAHGQWINKKEWHLGRWVAWLECSCCGEQDNNCEMYDMLPFGSSPSNYCPNCGARMDGVKNNEID